MTINVQWKERMEWRSPKIFWKNKNVWNVLEPVDKIKLVVIKNM